MSEEARLWKTEQEIRGIVHEIVNETTRDWHEEVRNSLQAQNGILEKIADGAQASILSANILHGNKDLGIPGAIPEFRERLATLESGQRGDRITVELHHANNSLRMDNLDVRLLAVETAQNRFSRRARTLLDWLLHDEKRAKVLIAIFSAFAFFAAEHLTTSVVLKRFVAFVGSGLLK